MSDALTLCWGIYQRQIYRKNKKKKKKKEVVKIRATEAKLSWLLIKCKFTMTSLVGLNPLESQRVHHDWIGLRIWGQASLKRCKFYRRFILSRVWIYEMMVMVCWRRHKSRDWDHKLIPELFTEVINQVRGRVIFSEAYVLTCLCNHLS